MDGTAAIFLSEIRLDKTEFHKKSKKLENLATNNGVVFLMSPQLFCGAETKEGQSKTRSGTAIILNPKWFSSHKGLETGQ